MIARLLRLKLLLLGNLFRRSTWQVVGIVFGLLYGMGITALAVLLLAGLRFSSVGFARPIVVIAGSVVVLGFLVVPLIVGVDDMLDPRKFALFGIERSRLAVSLAVAALIGIPAIVIVLVSLATIITWSRNPGTTLVALLAVPLTVAICVLLGRISAAAAGLLLSTRRARDATTAIAVLGLVTVSPIVVVIANARFGEAAGRAAGTLATVLGFTPLGASWAAPASIAAGDPAGLLQLVIAAASVALLWRAWRALVALTLVTPARQGRLQSYAGLGWFERLPARPGWAVAARSLTYWSRDVRYRLAVAMVPITPVVIVVVLLAVGVPVPVLALLPVPVMALFLGWTGHNDVAYDNTAVWLHIASGIRGSADRLGRAVPVLAVGAPVIVIGSLIAAAVNGRPAVALAEIGVSGCLLLAGVGFSFVSSARFPYPVPRPGDSPFQQPNATSALTAAVQSITFFAEIAVAAPALILGVVGLVTGGTGWFAASFAVGLLLGAAAFLLGLRFGGRTFERRGPEMLAAALRV